MGVLCGVGVWCVWCGCVVWVWCGCGVCGVCVVWVLCVWLGVVCVVGCGVCVVVLWLGVCVCGETIIDVPDLAQDSVFDVNWYTENPAPFTNFFIIFIKGFRIRSTDTPKIQHPNEVEVRVKSFGETTVHESTEAQKLKR